MAAFDGEPDAPIFLARFMWGESMRAFLMAAIALGALTGCGDRAPKSAPAPDAKAEAGATGLQYSYRQLDNGLRVYAMPDASTANVSVQVWYDVGSKDDPRGRSGFAHLFEHVMFKSTRNMPDEFFDRLTEDVGGFNNASTYDDFTNYFEVVPANHLRRILWAEAERMGSLVVDAAVFDSERDVVKEELRQRILASPYGRLFGLYLAQANYDVHPYGRPGIGSIEELDAATVDDVRAFHAAHYRPDNAVLVVAGNFQQADFDRWVDEYFAPVARPDRPIPRSGAVEPERTAPKSLTAYAPNVPLPAVTVSFPGVAANDADLAALMVLDAILSRGDSSRLYQSLVYKQQIAVQAFTFWEPTQDKSVYSLAAILSEGASPEDGLAALDAEIARLRNEPVSAAEVDEARNELVTEKLEARETAFGRAFELADSVIRYGDPDRADALLKAVDKISAEDVQRTAQRLFDAQKSVTIRYLPESEGARGDDIRTAATIETAALSIPPEEITVHSLAPESDRVPPPSPGAPTSAKIPSTNEKTLDNGLRVIVATKPGVPLVSASLRFSSGDHDDPAGLSGLADLTAELAPKGTPARSASEIAQAIEALGASLSTGADAGSASLSLMTRADRAREAFAIFADVARNPAFAEDELDRARQHALDELSVSMRQPGAIASRAMTRLVFGDGPAGGVATRKSLEAIDRKSVAAAHARGWRPEKGVLVIAGDISTENGFALAEAFFGDWRPASPAGLDGAPAAAGPRPAPRTVVVDLPNSGQAAVYFGLVGPGRTHEDYRPTMLAADILGGGYSARLNAEIRIKRGLSYGAFARFPELASEAPIIAAAQTRNDAAAEVSNLIAVELARLGAAPVPAAEMTARKAALIGQFGRDVETTAGVAGQISNLALFGLPPSELKSYVAEIERLDAAAVQGAAQRYFDPAEASVVVVGDASAFFDALKKDRQETERISIDALDLDSGALK